MRGRWRASFFPSPCRARTPLLSLSAAVSLFTLDTLAPYLGAMTTLAVAAPALAGEASPAPMAGAILLGDSWNMRHPITGGGSKWLERCVERHGCHGRPHFLQ